MSDFSEFMSRLVNTGLVVSGGDSANQHLSRRRRLLDRAGEHTSRTGFLAGYDALMRLAESVVARHGLAFGASPHAAMRSVVCWLDPSISSADIEFVCNERHKAKKDLLEPDPRAARFLRTWNASLPLAISGEEREDVNLRNPKLDRQ